MNKKYIWTILIILVLVLLGGALYIILNKKYYPKVKDVAYLKLELEKDTAQVKAGLQVLNRIPLSISIDSVDYTIKENGTELGWGQMTKPHTLPPLGDKVVDFRMLLDFEKYRQHLQEQQNKDSIKLDLKMNIFFDLPFISPKSITLNRHVSVPVPKAPKMGINDITVQSFSVDSGYSLLLKIDATNQDLPNLQVENLSYNILLDDSLKITGKVDSTFRIQKGEKVLEIPLQLGTSEVIALINKKLSGDNKWNYSAHLEAQIRSDHPIFSEFNLTVEKDGKLNMNKMGGNSNYLPSLRQVKRLEINSTEEQTQLQANVVVHNPSPIPFYIDSASYFIRHKGNLIASGKKDIEKILPKSGNQSLNLQLLVDESAYQKFMKNVQGQEKVKLDVELNLLYNLPDAKKQEITLQRQMQVPVPGQGGIKVKDLTLEELDPKKGAYLNLLLEVQSTNLPDLTIRNLDYNLQLGEDIQITGQTKEPIKVNKGNDVVKVPIHLSAENVNQLVRKALKGDINWNYELEASAELLSSNKMIGPTKLDFEFTGELEMAKGGGGKKLMPQITKVDTLDITIHYDTASVKLHIQVKNPLPVDFKVDSLLVYITHEQDTFAISQEGVGKVLPAEGSQSAWITFEVNYGLWHKHLEHHQDQDSLKLLESMTLVFSVGELAKQRVTFNNRINIPMPRVPAAELQKVKFRGLSLTKGILVNGLINVHNVNLKKLELSNLEYNVCVENLLDVCGTVNRTYHIAQGDNIIKVPMNLGVGEVFRALFAKLSGNKKRRNLYLNGTATVTTNVDLLQGTYVRFEKWEKTVMFKNKQKQQSSGSQETTQAAGK